MHDEETKSGESESGEGVEVGRGERTDDRLDAACELSRSELEAAIARRVAAGPPITHELRDGVRVHVHRDAESLERGELNATIEVRPRGELVDNPSPMRREHTDEELRAAMGAHVPPDTKRVPETVIADGVQRALEAVRRRVEKGELSREEALKLAHSETQRVLEELGLPLHVDALARLQRAFAPLGMTATVREAPRSNVVPFTRTLRRKILERVADVYGEAGLKPEELEELKAIRAEEAQGLKAIAEASAPVPWMQLEIFDSLDPNADRPVHAVIVRARGQNAGALHFNDREDRDRVLRALRAIVAADSGTLIEVTAIVHDLEGAKVDELTLDLYRRLTTRVVGTSDTLDGIRRRLEAEAMHAALLASDRDYKIDTSIAECMPTGSGKLIAEVKVTLAAKEARNG